MATNSETLDAIRQFHYEAEHAEERRIESQIAALSNKLRAAKNPLKRHRYGKRIQAKRARPAPAFTKPFTISELTYEQRFIVGYGGAMGYTDFRWSQFNPREIVARIDDSETFWRIEDVVESRAEKNPNAILAATIYLASIGEQLEQERTSEL